MTDKTPEQMISNLTRSGNEEAEETLRIEPDVDDIEQEGASEDQPPVEAASDGEGEDSDDAQDSATEEDEADESDKEDYVSREDFDRVHQEAVKRRHTIKELKQRLLKQEQNIEQMFATVQEQLKSREAPDPEVEAVANDPAVRLLREDIRKLREDAGLTPEQIRREEEAERRQAAIEQANEILTDYINVNRESFQKQHPDYQEAVEFALTKRAGQLRRSGLSEQEAMAAVNEEMIEMCARAFDQDLNPAELAYQMAVEDYNWHPENNSGPPPEEKPAPKPAPRTMDSVARIKAGMKSQSVSGMSGDRGGTGEAPARATMTRDQFYSQVDPGTRIQVLSDQSKFEELARTGKITVDWV